VNPASALKMLLRLLKGSKPKPKPNRRLSPEELAEKYPKKDIGYPFTKELRELPMGNFPASAAMRARQVGDETMEMVRRSVSKMDLPQAKKAEAFEDAMARIRHLQRFEPAQLAKMDPSVLAKNIMKKFGFPIGAAVGYGVADNKEAIADMLKSVKLPTKLDVDLGMTPAGDLFGGAAMMEREGFPQGRKQKFSSGPIPMRPSNRGQLFDRPDEEPGLEEGSIDDLLLWNRMFGG